MNDYTRVTSGTRPDQGAGAADHAIADGRVRRERGSHHGTRTGTAGLMPRRHRKCRYDCMALGRKERATGVEPAMSSFGKLIDDGPADYDPCG